MRTIRTKVYKFEELTSEAQTQALNEHGDINIELHDWYEFVYEDAENIGLKLTGFDLDRGCYCTGRFTEKARLVADDIIREHGEQTDSYKTATKYIADYNRLVDKYSDGFNKNVVAIENESDFEVDSTDLEDDFLDSLLEDYKKLLQTEYDYLTSDEAIKETIISNGYEFTKDGKKFNY